MSRQFPISNYTKVMKKTEATAENEIRVRINSPPFSYAAYAGKILLDKKSDFVYLNATGAAVSNSIKVIEYLKRHVKGLHVEYKIQSRKFVDEYEPKVEGLDKVVTERIVSTLECVLTLTKGDTLKNSPGYLAPGDVKEDDTAAFQAKIKEYEARKEKRKERGENGEEEEDGDRPRRRGGRGGPRGGRFPRNFEDREDRRGGDREDRRGGDRDRDFNRPPRNNDGAPRGDRGENRPRYNDGAPRGDRGENRPRYNDGAPRGDRDNRPRNNDGAPRGDRGENRPRNNDGPRNTDGPRPARGGQGQGAPRGGDRRN
jgi:hypothetical protein